MKFRSLAVATVATGAMLLPNIAAAADVHVMINLSHVQRDSGRKLKVSGALHSYSGSTCEAGRHIAIQRRKNSGARWNTLGYDTTSDSGNYKKVVGDKPGQYRAVAHASGSCEKDVSDVAKHSH